MIQEEDETRRGAYKRKRSQEEEESRGR